MSLEILRTLLEAKDYGIWMLLDQCVEVVSGPASDARKSLPEKEFIIPYWLCGTVLNADQSKFAKEWIMHAIVFGLRRIEGQYSRLADFKLHPFQGRPFRLAEGIPVRSHTYHELANHISRWCTDYNHDLALREDLNIVRADPLFGFHLLGANVLVNGQNPRRTKSHLHADPETEMATLSCLERRQLWKF